MQRLVVVSGGSFANVTNGQRLATIDGLGTFLVHYGSGCTLNPEQIILTNVGLTGNYNQDGAVDAADYVIWRKTGIDGQPGYDDGRHISANRPAAPVARRYPPPGHCRLRFLNRQPSC